MQSLHQRLSGSIKHLLMQPCPKMKDDETRPVRGENIAFRPGAVISFLVGNAGLLAVAIWWAASLQADVRNLQRDIASLRESVRGLDKMASLEADLREMRQFGSENARKTAEALVELRKEFELHKAVSK